MINTFVTNITLTIKVFADLHPKNLRYFFYMFTPNESIYENVDDIPDFLLDSAMSWMIALILLEYLMTDKKNYALNDTVTSVNAGLLSNLLMRFGKHHVMGAFYPMLYSAVHIVDLPKDSVSTWILCFFTEDLAFYLGHRAVHEAGVLWSLHHIHHSSEYYNLSTALRLSAIQDVFMLFFDMLHALAIPPNIFITHKYLNFVFPFWLHSNAVPYLGPLEYFLNTPSSHRVHHGRNPYCIDRNYGGVLIIWDRLFGTYEPERKDDAVVYGSVTPVKSFDQLWLHLSKNYGDIMAGVVNSSFQLFPFKTLGYDKGRMRNEKNEELFPGVLNKVKATFWPPAYFPGMRTKQFFLWRSMKDHTEGIPKIEPSATVRFNPPLSNALRYYLFVQWALLMSCFTQFDEIRIFLDWPEFICRLGFIIFFIQMFGYYFNHSRFALIFDPIRLILSMLLGFSLSDFRMILYSLVSLSVVVWLVSAGKICVICGFTKEGCSD